MLYIFQTNTCNMYNKITSSKYLFYNYYKIICMSIFKLTKYFQVLLQSLKMRFIFIEIANRIISTQFNPQP